MIFTYTDSQFLHRHPSERRREEAGNNKLLAPGSRPLLTLEPKVRREQSEMVKQRVSCGPEPAPTGHL